MRMTVDLLVKYIEGWINGHFEEWSYILQAISRDKRTGIYRISNGPAWLNALQTIMSYIEEQMYLQENEHLIPSRFSSPHQLIRFLKNFGDYASNQK